MISLQTSCMLLATLTIALRSTCAFPAEDRVHLLPGYYEPLPSDWYSGYLEYSLPCMGNRTIHTHYIYVEAATNGETKDPDDMASESRRKNKEQNDETPLIFWSNGTSCFYLTILYALFALLASEPSFVCFFAGGPGASSMFGLFTEVGPLQLNEDSLQTDSYHATGVPTLFDNPNSWNRLGSLLIFDAPAPVGFSYCDDEPGGDGLSCGGWDDDSSAWNNYHALLAFYTKFPELRKRPLYLTGESYAGIYIPSMARKILENRHSLRIPNSIPLKGFAVGDGCTGNQVNCFGAEAPYYNLLFFAGHGQISIKLFHSIVDSCGEAALKTGGSALSEECKNMLNKATKQAGGFYEYSLYDDCTYSNGIRRRRRQLEVVTGALNDYVCGGGPAMEEYVKHALVKEALHVPKDSFFFDGDNGVGFNYSMTEPNLMPFYTSVAKGMYAKEGVRVIVYNGDTDPSINSFVAQNWTSHLGLKEVEAWRPWTIDSCRRMGGYVTRYEGSFDFLTIRGAGHMVRVLLTRKKSLHDNTAHTHLFMFHSLQVPTYKPESAFAFLQSWIANESYPEFDPTCTHP